MEYAEFKRQLGKSGIITGEFARLTKLHQNSITNYSLHGRVPKNLTVIVTLMGHMADHQLPFKDVLEKINITPNKHVA